MKNAELNNPDEVFIVFNQNNLCKTKPSLF